ERAEIPPESPLHRAIDIVDRVRDIRRNARRIDERRSKRRAQKRPDFVAAKKQRLDSLADVGERLRGLQRREASRSSRTVLERRRTTKCARPMPDRCRQSESLRRDADNAAG